MLAALFNEHFFFNILFQITLELEHFSLLSILRAMGTKNLQLVLTLSLCIFTWTDFVDARQTFLDECLKQGTCLKGTLLVPIPPMPKRFD